MMLAFFNIDDRIIHQFLTKRFWPFGTGVLLQKPRGCKPRGFCKMQVACWLYVPSSHEFRYLTCSSVRVSILNAHGAQLDAGDLGIDLCRHGVDALFQRLRVLHHELRRQGLVGKGHVHHGSRMPFGGGQVDEASLAEDVDLASILGHRIVPRTGGQVSVRPSTSFPARGY